MKGFRKKEKKPLLYKKYQEEKEKREEALKQKPFVERPKVNESTAWEYIHEEQNCTEESLRRAEPYSVFITSLKNRCGCSYLAYALKEFFAMRQKDVCLVTDFERGFPMEEYEYLVFDCGCLEDLEPEEKREMFRANVRIMMCIYEEEYLEALAQFIQGEKSVAHWKFVFNFIPKKKQKEVEDLMEGYCYAFLPLFLETKEIQPFIKMILK